MNDIDKFIQEAIENIHEDRKVTKDLLKDVMRYMSVDEAHHEKVGTVAAKYVETLQRSNEQLVKVVALIQKKTAGNQGLSAKDKDELFDLIQGGK
tara:strand:+ start:888 stop:1172 length:285 start_codon:yes stop_codon:yes gene_type:complete